MTKKQPKKVPETEVSEAEILKDEARKLLGQADQITVSVNRSFWDKILGKPDKRVFTIQPLFLGTLLKIMPLMLEIDMEPVMGKVEFWQGALTVGTRSISLQAEILAHAFYNKPGNTPKDLKSFILGNFTPKQMKDTAIVILKQMDMDAFLNSIILMKRGMSLANPGTIAGQTEKPLQA